MHRENRDITFPLEKKEQKIPTLLTRTN